MEVGQIVQNGREKEGQNGDGPQKAADVFGFDFVSDDGKTFVGIYDFHDSHGAQEERRGCRKFRTNVPARHARLRAILRPKQVERPTKNPVTSAAAALSIFKLCSKAMAAYPRIKTAIIKRYIRQK